MKYFTTVSFRAIQVQKVTFTEIEPMTKGCVGEFFTHWATNFSKLTHKWLWGKKKLKNLSYQQWPSPLMNLTLAYHHHHCQGHSDLYPWPHPRHFLTELHLLHFSLFCPFSFSQRMKSVSFSLLFYSRSYRLYPRCTEIWKEVQRKERNQRQANRNKQSKIMAKIAI